MDILSGPGTADGHWSENRAGGQHDLMTGFLHTPATISDTTIQSFRDLG